MAVLMTTFLTMLALCLCLSLLWGQCAARSGVDLSVVTDNATWECLAANNISFAIVRAYRSLGQIDPNAPTTIDFAWKAGIPSVDAYMFPCITSSSYALSHNITCDSADKQVADTLALLSTTKIGRMWIDVEDESPSKYYDSGKYGADYYVSEALTLQIRSR
jgi:hypothetical protein